MAAGNEGDGIGDDTERKPEQKEIEPDAVAQDGVLSLLTAPGPSRHQRSLSAGSRAQLDAQDMQQQYNVNRLALEQQLGDLMDLLDRLLAFNKVGQIQEPQSKLAVLQIDLKLGASSVVVGTPSRQLIESKIAQVVKHAAKLRARLRNTDSHVLVTGDLNAGKSSLCNALLRRPVLPVDQQPCTDVFCEVVDATKNQGTEEVHAVLLNKTYDVLDTTTYEKFSLDQLKSLVHQSNVYKLLRVYLRDPRPPHQSLLANGVVDICLIDAPGLNVSEVTTTELFGRQEEIDLVIFVVSAENHFTQSAKEFVADTAREKSLVFIAVNNYDKIEDKSRCRDRVMKQVADIAPETHKGAGDFVHFVSSNPPDSDPNGGDNNRGNNGPGTPDFDRLEASLRNFVLERRSASKLAPARTYLLNVLNDLVLIAKHNTEQASGEHKELISLIKELEPTIDKTVGEYAAVSDKIDRETEQLCHALLQNTETYLSDSVNTIGDEPVTEYTGIMNVFSYAARTREILVQRIQQSVVHCEDEARQATASAVDSVKQLGILHVGEQPAFSKVFQQSAMFSRRKDNLSKHIMAEFTVLDALDLSLLLERPLPVLNSSRKALVASATSTASAGSAVGGAITVLSLYQTTGLSTVAKVQQVVGTRRLVIPLLVLAVVGLGAWVIHELPRTIARKLARKIAFEIDELGYVRSNAERIAGECRKVLRYPAQDVRAAFQSQLESRTRQRDELERHVRDAKEALAVFADIDERAEAVLTAVRRLELH